MDASNALADEASSETRPAAVLRGTARGLEIVVDATASVESITMEVMKRLEEAPQFFRGGDVRIRVDQGPLPTGCLSRLDEIAIMFDLRIVEVTAAKKEEAVPEEQPQLAAGSVRAAPVALPPDEVVEIADLDVRPEENEPATFDEPTQVATRIDKPAPAEPTPIPVAPAAVIEKLAPGARLVIGPVRSGVILDHIGHVIVFGDVNPGAELRATGNIVVLGRLRGTAHAAIGRDTGFILALRLEPQQLRIGRQVARAGDSDKPVSEPEIAYLDGAGILVERYTGKLPRNLATSI